MCTIRASQAGDSSFHAATPVDQSSSVVYPVIVLRVADSGATEGSGPGVTTVASMLGVDRPTSAALCVWYSTVGVPATGVDKIAAHDGVQDFTNLGISKPKFVILGATRTSGKISTKVNYDSVIEEDEYFNVVVSKVAAQVSGKRLASSAQDSRVVLVRDTGRVTIFDDDTPVPQN